jgi:hypothetical protein
LPNGINIDIQKLPESPLFWILVAFGVFIYFLATGHVMTALVFFLAAVAVGCFIFNLAADEPSPVVWGICVACAVLALICGILAVPSEWQTQASQ